MDIPRTSSYFDLPESKNMQNTVMATVKFFLGNTK